MRYAEVDVGELRRQAALGTRGRRSRCSVFTLVALAVATSCSGTGVIGRNRVGDGEHATAGSAPRAQGGAGGETAGLGADGGVDAGSSGLLGEAGSGGSSTASGAGGAGTGAGTGGTSAAATSGGTGALAGSGGTDSAAGAAGDAPGEAGAGGNPAEGDCVPGSVYDGDYRTGVHDRAAVERVSRITGSVEVVAGDLEALRCVTAIDGGLTVSAPPDLDALERLTSIGEDLTLSGALQDLEGLRNLTTVGGALDITEEASLLGDLGGLRGLVSIGGYLSVRAPGLTSLGLTSLISIGDFFFVDSAMLTRLDGPPNLATLAGDFYVTMTHPESLLEAVGGFDSLTSIGGGLWVSCPNRVLSLALPYLQTIGADLNLSCMNDGGSIAPVFERLTAIGNSLTITALDVTDLRGLSGVTSIGHELQLLDNRALENLDALSNLTNVGGIVLTSNTSLRNIDGLRNVTRLPGNLFISGAPLAELEALSGLTTIGGGLSLDDVPLGTLNGLRNVSTIGAHLNLQKTNLRDLRGLERLSAICAEPAGMSACDLDVWSNPLLESLDGLPATAELSQITLFDNDALADLSALRPVRRISNDILIAFNDSLTSIADLAAIEFVGNGVTVLDNARLPTCAVHAWRLGIDYWGGAFFIDGNDDLASCD